MDEEKLKTEAVAPKAESVATPATPDTPDRRGVPTRDVATSVPPLPEVIVPKVTEEPQWQLSKEEWQANQLLMKSLAEKIPGLEGISNALSPLADAINDVTSEETAPARKKNWLRRKLWT